jgi:hypothetical protein
VFEPRELMARLAALVPPPRMHLTRYHGVFAPHSRLRAAVTLARRARAPGSAAASELCSSVCQSPLLRSLAAPSRKNEQAKGARLRDRT